MKSIETNGRLDAILRGEPVSWSALGMSRQALLDDCRTLEISELVHHHLQSAGLPQDWPEDVRAALSGCAHLSAARELIRAREMALVLEHLVRHRIHPILLKGAPLAHAVYESPGLRPRADTDLLIRRQDVAIVRKAFLDLGYHAPVMSDGEQLFRQFQMAKRDAHGMEHVFDVHWSISTQALFANMLTYDELDEAAVAVPALGVHARCASGVHALMLACIHPVMHHRNSDRLIWIYDVHLLVRELSEEGMTSFANLAIRKGIAEICAEQLTVATRRFHTPLPADLISSLRAASGQERSRTYLRPHRRWHDEVLSNMTGLRRWGDRGRLLREILLPHPRYMLKRYGLGSGGAPLLPLLYLYRTARGALKVLAGRK